MIRPSFVTNFEVLKTGSLMGVCGRQRIKGTKMESLGIWCEIDAVGESLQLLLCVRA
jgi:hypothetical protein